MKKVIIIGGGVAGLGAALKVQRAAAAGEDVDFVLVEKDDRLGGKIDGEIVDQRARHVHHRRRPRLLPDRQACGQAHRR